MCVSLSPSLPLHLSPSLHSPASPPAYKLIESSSNSLTLCRSSASSTKTKYLPPQKNTCLEVESLQVSASLSAARPPTLVLHAATFVFLNFTRYYTRKRSMCTLEGYWIFSFIFIFQRGASFSRPLVCYRKPMLATGPFFFFHTYRDAPAHQRSIRLFYFLLFFFVRGAGPALSMRPHKYAPIILLTKPVCCSLNLHAAH